jgi:hypothetical protein
MPHLVPRRTLTFDVVRVMALELPGVEESMVHGAPSLKVRGKLLACPAIHSSAEPNTIAVRIDRAQRAKLVESAPGIYYVTDHYLDFPMVLVRLARIGRGALKNLLEQSWRFESSQAKTTGEMVPRRRRSKRP